jgi:rubrerythrin
MNEYIKRSDILDEITTRRNQAVIGKTEAARWKKIIEAIPAADVVEVRHGRLLNPNPYGECSLCGHLIDIRDGYNYCPNCGAIMDKEAE